MASTRIAEAAFWQRTEGEPCEVCRHHKYIIVQKLGPWYVMHSHLAMHVEPVSCLHVWLSRAEDPPCLACFEPVTTAMPPLIIHEATLIDLLADLAPRT